MEPTRMANTAIGFTSWQYGYERWNCKMAGVRKSSPSATGVEMGCVVKVDPIWKKIKHTHISCVLSQHR